MTNAPREHELDGSVHHHEWDATLDPILTIESGDIVQLRLPQGGDPAIREDSVASDINLDAFVYRLVGPIEVAGAQAGDALEIEIHSLVPGDWGWTVIAPGLGLLPDHFPDLYLKTWDLRNRERAVLAPGLEVSLAASIGTIGVHPGTPPTAPPFPPHRGGGNLDNRSLCAGTRLWLPVWLDGGLLSCGDGHAAQGDGEVCISAIECELEAVLRVHLRRGLRLSTPRFAVEERARARVGSRGTMGIDEDLREGARTAVLAMIEWLVDEYGISHEDAYVFCSVAGDLRILELVNMGVWNVGFTLPVSVSRGPQASAGS